MAVEHTFPGDPVVAPAPIAPLIRRSPTIGKLMGALAKAQANFGPVTKNKKNSHLNTSYADMESVVTATRPALNANGIAVTESCTVVDGDYYAVIVLGHESGEWTEASCPVALIDSTNNKGRKTLNDMQEFGNSLAYARRYAWQMATGVVSTDDDDGQSAARNNSRQRFTAGPQSNRGQNNAPPRRPQPAPSNNRPPQSQQQQPAPNEGGDGSPPWANGMTPEQISGATRAYYSLDGGRSVAAAVAHIGLDGGALSNGGDIKSVVGGLLDVNNPDHIINKAMINAVVKAAIGGDDPESIDTELLIERINNVDLAKTLSAFPPPQD